mgnify:CR=1 FL=1
MVIYPESFSLKVNEGNASHFNTKTIKPTCTLDGYTLHTCDMCGYSYKSNTTNKLGHSYGEWTIETYPSFETEGYAYRLCSKDLNK